MRNFSHASGLLCWWKYIVNFLSLLNKIATINVTVFLMSVETRAISAGKITMSINGAMILVS